MIFSWNGKFIKIYGGQEKTAYGLAGLADCMSAVRVEEIVKWVNI